MTYDNVKIGNEEPFVGISNEMVVYGGKRCAIKRITVQGKIYEHGKECNQDVFTKIQNFSKAIIDDFKTFSAGGFSAEYARCESLSITNSNSFGAEYQAEFLAYPKEWFSDIIEVLEPVDSARIIENKNGTISIVRTIAGRGITSDSLGINKVYNWIKTLNVSNIEDSKIIALAEIAKISINRSAKPTRISQTVNRLDGTVNTEVEFNFNLNSTSKTVLNISVDISYDAKIGIYTARVDGTLSGPIGMSMSDLRLDLKKVLFYDFASNQMPTNTPPLDTLPVSKNITENESEISITFNYIYNTLIGEKIINSTTTIEHDVVKDIKSIGLQGTVVLNKKPQSERKIQKDTLINIDFSKVAVSEFQKYFLQNGVSSNNNQTLSTKVPKSYNISLNNTDFIGNYNVSYDDSSIIDPSLGLPPEIYSFEYQINYTPSIKIKLPLQFIPGNQGIFDLKAIRRGSLSINGTALSTKNIDKTLLLNCVQVIVDRIKEKEKFNNIHVERKTCNFSVNPSTNVQYSFEISITAETKLYGN